ncbi:MAG: TIGR01777 family protein [Ignavibacteriae bacterium HGW-Ignavibacteriae-1]|jgi:hypothetical protein|nr:MAG: TIGR01777 family protein [Ignavibacteriae bacterium HGW-Ignavibacteriae-1]
MKIISVIGGTGLIGTRLVESLLSSGYGVRLFVRSLESARSKFDDRVEIIEWKNDVAYLSTFLSGNFGIINLAGAPLADSKWTEEYKKEIIQSRTKTTSLIVNAIEIATETPKILINASAIGIYGSQGANFLTERSDTGNDFLAQVCKAWEHEALKAQSQTRVVVLRIGIVLSANGGALEKLLLPFKLYVGGALGDGKQYWSWIHIDDLVAMFAYALLNDTMTGVYNAVAPNPVKVDEFARILGKVMGKPSFFKVPKFLLNALLGESAEMVLSSQNVSAHKILDKGFLFKFPELKESLRDLLKNSE